MKHEGDAVAALGVRVEAWRRTRMQRTGAMPEELWREAAGLAARHGVYRISQALRLNFENLKKRTLVGGGLAKRPFAAQRTAQTRADFVEMMGIGEVGLREAAREAAHTEIEITTDGGARFRLRHAGGGVDLPGVVAAFLREAR